MQADLTVIVPGPPEPALAAELAVAGRRASRAAGPPSTGSRRTACGGRWTPVTPPADMHDAVPAAVAHRRCRRRCSTSSTTWPAATVGCGSAAPGRTCAATTRRWSARCCRPAAGRADAAPAGADGAGHAPSGRPGCWTLLRDAGYAPVPRTPPAATVLTRPKAARGPVRPTPRGGRLDDFDPPQAGRAAAGRGGGADPPGRPAGPGGPPVAADPDAGGRGRAPVTRARPTPRRWPCCGRRSTSRPGSGSATWTRTAASASQAGPAGLHGRRLPARRGRPGRDLHTFALHRITVGRRSTSLGLAGSLRSAPTRETTTPRANAVPDRLAGGVEQVAVQDQPGEQEPQQEDHRRPRRSRASAVDVRAGVDPSSSRVLTVALPGASPSSLSSVARVMSRRQSAWPDSGVIGDLPWLTARRRRPRPRPATPSTTPSASPAASPVVVPITTMRQDEPAHAQRASTGRHRQR